VAGAFVLQEEKGLRNLLSLRSQELKKRKRKKREERGEIELGIGPKDQLVKGGLVDYYLILTSQNKKEECCRGKHTTSPRLGFLSN